MSFYYRYNNEALKNIERENKRQDFIKRLIEEEVTDEWVFSVNFWFCLLKFINWDIITEFLDIIKFI